MYYIKGILLMAVIALTLAGVVLFVISNPSPPPAGRVVYFECSRIDGKANIARENWWVEEHHLRSDIEFVRLAIVHTGFSLSDTGATVLAVYADSTADKVGHYKSVGCWWLPGEWKQKVCPRK